MFYILSFDRLQIQIADFGLASTSGNPSKGHVKLSGTSGYVAPEYLLDGNLIFDMIFALINYKS